MSSGKGANSIGKMVAELEDVKMARKEMMHRMWKQKVKQVDGP